MFTGVPNMAWVFGYFRASWTLRADLLADFVCRLLKHMDAKGATVVTPTLRAAGPGHGAAALGGAGELQPRLPGARHRPAAAGRATHQPWLHRQDYAADKDELPRADLDDGALVFS